MAERKTLQTVVSARAADGGAATCFFLCLAPLDFHRTQLWAVLLVALGGDALSWNSGAGAGGGGAGAITRSPAMQRPPGSSVVGLRSLDGGGGGSSGGGGKSPAAASAPAQLGKRYCVQGKRGGVVDDESPLSKAWRAARLDGSSDEDGDGAGGIGECETPLAEQPKGADGVRRYDIDGPTEALLREFFAPYNAKLFELVGRTLPWPSSSAENAKQ